MGTVQKDTPVTSLNMCISSSIFEHTNMDRPVLGIGHQYGQTCTGHWAKTYEDDSKFSHLCVCVLIYMFSFRYSFHHTDSGFDINNCTTTQYNEDAAATIKYSSFFVQISIFFIDYENRTQPHRDER